ncbi:hypothetical protein [Campylobacter sp. RM16188]|uniref:hypothetical protein n=1 Tax=Campylobacter sp. RM16188 TaxID=1705725 RepID=UPI001553DFFE|nr:hypothetical protein [Campylobacter sp. RM16188]
MLDLLFKMSIGLGVFVIAIGLIILIVAFPSKTIIFLSAIIGIFAYYLGIPLIKAFCR